MKSWVKNYRLSPEMSIRYRKRGRLHSYIPDFIVVTDSDQKIIVEIKGRDSDDVDIKKKVVERWVKAVNRLETYGQWHYLLVYEVDKLGEKLNRFTNAK